jgi:pimeloyl-ACP methyl ester carboxylesterase
MADVFWPTMIVQSARDASLPRGSWHPCNDLIESSLLNIMGHCGHVPQIEQAQEFNTRLIYQPMS